MVGKVGAVVEGGSGVGKRALDGGSMVANWLSGVGDRAVIGQGVGAELDGGERCVERCRARCVERCG